MANAEYEPCPARNSCELFRSFSIGCTIAAEEGQPPPNPSPNQCLGILPQGETCARYLGPSSDEDGQSLSTEPRYSLDD